MGVPAGLAEEHFSKGGEHVSVNYVPMPEGPVAEMIFYSVPPGVMSRQEVLDEFTKRYGSRSYEYADSMGGKHVVWCSVSKSNCDRTELNLSVQTGIEATSVFVEDPRQWDRQKQAILAAPGRQKAAF